MQPTNVEDGDGQLDVAKVSRTFLLVFAASCAHYATVDSAQLGIVQALLARPLALLVQRLCIFDVAYTHALDLLG